MNHTYGTILVDPPWSYRQSKCNGAAAKQYPTMSDDEICEIPVSSFAAPDCALLLWATWPKLITATKVITAWGFEYVTGFPWVKVTDVKRTLFGDLKIKVRYGIGYWARGVTEPLLIARRGKVSPPDNGFIGLLCPNLSHSRKPDSVYDYGEALPGPRLEMFARRKRPGWDAWGNEIENDVELLTP